ncbi:ATP-grasp domain-containing protein [Alicyclobacillus dauci]|uniref:Alpha-L-glutamate ligase n=1 Tax=Alicyclobacillus dauci TaxID=1475485 RepID=A0ABY6Z977_9BACL|nr:alpha-L-glutamate ligase [Alicyclobacillus dauci]WAH38811.1 alpha-L-glutamate ligase [Alicyclobacillus dauci]
MAKVYVLHENTEWTIHLTRQLDALGVPYEEWHLDEGQLDLSQTPPEGVFYSRMSASSHTRNHRYAAEFTGAVIGWLEKHGRQVINGSRALQLEVSKAAQYLALQAAGIRTPETVVAVGKQNILQAAAKFKGRPFITKHNRAGKGLGVQLFHTSEALETYLEGPTFEAPVDGITLVQEYIQAPESFITRCEFVGGKFLYAVQVDTSGGFELCPADACQVGDLFCPVGEAVSEKPKFQIIPGFHDAIIESYESLLAENQIGVAGIEFIRDMEGNIFTYDINTNTNYNAEAERAGDIYGMRVLAQYLSEQLERLRPTRNLFTDSMTI